MKIENDDVEWIVNDMGELGVKIFNQTFFLYKGESYSGGDSYRNVFKREFGETCYPWDVQKMPGDSFSYTVASRVSNYIGHHGEPDDLWRKTNDSTN